MTLFKCRNFATKQVENVFELQVACSTFIDGLFGVGKSIHCKVFRRLPFVVFVATRRRVAVLGGVLQTFSTKQVESVFSFHVVLSTVIEGLFGVVKVNSMQGFRAFAVCCLCCHTAACCRFRRCVAKILRQ